MMMIIIIKKNRKNALQIVSFIDNKRSVNKFCVTDSFDWQDLLSRSLHALFVIAYQREALSNSLKLFPSYANCKSCSYRFLPVSFSLRYNNSRRLLHSIRSLLFCCSIPTFIFSAIKKKLGKSKTASFQFDTM